MKCLKVAGAVLAILGAAQAAAVAAPVQVDFNVAGFGPVSGSTAIYTRQDAYNDVDFTFQSMNAQLEQANRLYWDSDDGRGLWGDGFGVMGSGSYEDDEIEGDERLGLQFSRAVNLLGINVTDFFNEQTPPLQICDPGVANCYLETGQFMVQFGDNTTSGWLNLTALSSSTLVGNGLLSVAMNFQNVTGLFFRAPGLVPSNFESPFVERHEFSLAGVIVDESLTPAPEPGTMALLGLGLSGLAAARRRRRG